MNKRHQIILELINNKKKISVNELAELTNVSLVTIRNDLSILEQQNYVKRSHVPRFLLYTLMMVFLILIYFYQTMLTLSLLTLKL